MENGEKVFYFDGTSARPRPARLLVYDRSLQLYEVEEDRFIAAFPHRDVKLLSQDNSYAHFSLLPDGSQALDIPQQHPLLPAVMAQVSGADRSISNKLMRFKVPLLVLIFLAAVTGLYFLLVAGVSGLALQLISPKKEAEIGNIVFKSMLAGQEVDTAATHALVKFAGNLQLSRSYHLQYTVLNDPEINAFAIPGGHIVVYKGILQKIQSPEELAALLGHESTHVNERHSLRTMLQQMTGGIVLSMVFGDLGSLGGVFAERANALRSLSYSRGLESEADEKGMEKMTANGVSPQGMVLLMDRLQEAEKDVHLPGFLSTHPLTVERKQSAQRFVREHPFSGKPDMELELDWKALKAICGDPVPSPENRRGKSSNDTGNE